MIKARIQIVDEKDTIVDYKYYSDVDYSKDYYRVSSLWLRNCNGQILLAQRKYSKKLDPGKWGPAVAGTVEEGETYESNIVKEIEEEIGLKQLNLTLGPKQKFDKPRHYFLQWFYAIEDIEIDGLTLQEDEVEQAVWINPNDLKINLDSHPDKYIPIFPKILELHEPQLY